MARWLTLRWLDLGGIEQERELSAGEHIIGRGTGSDVVLQADMVSRTHARIVVTAEGEVSIEDLGSRNGTYLGGERTHSASLKHGDEVTVGGVSLFVEGSGIPPAIAETVFGLDLDDDEAEAGFRAQSNDSRTIVPQSRPSPQPRPGTGSVVPDELLDRPLLSEAALREAGVEVQVVDVAALGAGIGSFVFVDLLRVSGVSSADIAVLGVETNPMARWARLCANSQIPLHERIRSNSESTPDNLWGFPGYAVREGARALKRGDFKTGATCFWNIFGEPAISQTYTPRLHDVVSSVEVEAKRIGWQEMLRNGRIRHIRKSEEGRLVAIISQSDANQRRHIAVSAKAMHLSVGYPAVQLLPDLAEYRESSADFEHVVNAYEPHDHIYERLRERGGVALLRGRGIVASRVLQRLWEERKHNPNIQVIHLHRSRLSEGHRFGRARRKVEEQYEFQPFNWPKSCWGGEHLELIENSGPEARKALLDELGGTSTANRTDWRDIVREGVREGWYRSEFGTVDEVSPTEDGRVSTRIRSTLGGGGELALLADYVIDCTGLVAAAGRSPLLADMLDRYDVPLNPLGRLAVSNDYEISAMRHGESRMYAAGALTLGGPMAAVDSFLGLQFSAMRSVDGMQDMRIAGLRRLNGVGSFGQWWKWVRKVAP